MKDEQFQLVTTSIRLSREAIRILEEQSSVLRKTKSQLIREWVAEGLEKWQAAGRRRALKSLVASFDKPEPRASNRNRNHRYANDAVYYWSTDEHGNEGFVDAPSLRELERHLADSGTPEKFVGYLDFEQALWMQHEERLQAIDADPRFVDDEDEPACWKRDWQKYREEMDHREAVTCHRNALIRTSNESRQVRSEDIPE